MHNMFLTKVFSPSARLALAHRVIQLRHNPQILSRREPYHKCAGKDGHPDGYLTALTCMDFCFCNVDGDVNCNWMDCTGTDVWKGCRCGTGKGEL
jgi:hypothetical protein